ncbi:hypothetical protein AGMMS49990_06270 [Endomicrobiia bacterium]|nr:hypothetical protein AGMMS49990_06270 [Endomicrobiia bacterium]
MYILKFCLSNLFRISQDKCEKKFLGGFDFKLKANFIDYNLVVHVTIKKSKKAFMRFVASVTLG